MRFMGLWHPAKTNKPASEKEYAEMGQLIMDMVKAGVMVDTGGWDPASPSTIIQKSGGKVTITDGPYAEAKEMIAGFVIMEVKSKEEALDWCTRFIKITGEGYSEIRELPGPPPKK